MKKLAYAASLLASMALVACGGDDGTNVQIPDASIPIDGGNNSGVCDVLAGTGCEDGEKCTFIIDDNLQSFPSVCLAAGSVPEGGDCAYTDIDAAMTQAQDQDCVKGTQCIRGLCAKVAAGEAFSCDDQGLQTARIFGGVWADQPDARDIGFCVDQCDPLLQATCTNDPGDDGNFGTADDRVEGCFRKAYFAGQTFVDIDFQCFGVDTVTNTQTAAGDPCVGPAAGQCYLNGVPRGTTLMGTGSTTPQVVTPYCRFREAHLETGADQGARDALANGDPALIEGDRPGDCSATNFGTGDQVGGSQWECTSFDEMAFSFIDDTAAAGVEAAFMDVNAAYDLPSNVGICVDTTQLGVIAQGGDPVQLYPTVTDFNLQNVRDDIGDGTFDGLIVAAEYELCIDCLTTDGWAAFAGGLSARIKSAVANHAARAKMIQRTLTEAPIAPMSPAQVRSAITGR